MSHPKTDDSSRLVCPTCWGDVSDAKDLAYFASSSGPHRADDITSHYEEVSRLIHFLGALAQASPRAIAQNEAPVDDWVMYLSWLGEELAGEADRRLALLHEAGHIWRRRAEESPARKGA